MFISSETLTPHNILFLGTPWWGSDCRAISSALRRQDCNVFELNYRDFIPEEWSSFHLKVIRKMLKRLAIHEYNKRILSYAENSSLHFVLAIKGNYLYPKTIEVFKKKNIPFYCFYPDLSFQSHGSYIPKIIHKFNHIFTTKEFHLKNPFAPINISYAPHGYDSEVHRPKTSSHRLSNYSCDISFVGAWSPYKEEVLKKICRNSKLKINIWGPGWEKSESLLRKFWRRKPITGDELTLQYQQASINLGLLSKADKEGHNHDQITTRTWQIPASGGFILHEYSPKIERNTFLQDIPMFRNSNELMSKIEYFLANPLEREKKRLAIVDKVRNSSQTYDRVAKTILQKYHQDQLHQS